VVSRSVVLERSVIGRRAFVDRSLLGADARVTPDESVLSVVKVAREPAAGGRPRPRRPVWESIRAALGPAPQNS